MFSYPPIEEKRLGNGHTIYKEQISISSRVSGQGFRKGCANVLSVLFSQLSGMEQLRLELANS